MTRQQQDHNAPHTHASEPVPQSEPSPQGSDSINPVEEMENKPLQASFGSPPAEHGDRTCRVRDVLAALSEIAPPELAETWDAVGLQVGDPQAGVQKVLLSLDASIRSISLARKLNCQLILTHHPLIFAPLPALRPDQPIQKNVILLIQNQIALITAHTNLDMAHDGVADTFARSVGQALHGKQQPAAGESPYCRQILLTEPRSLFEIYHQIHHHTGAAGSRLNSDQDRLIQSVAVWPGSLDEAVLPHLEAAGVQMVICGECKHHLGLTLADSQIAVMDVGHDVSERVVLRPLMEKLREKLPGLLFAVDGGFDYNKIAY